MGGAKRQTAQGKLELRLLGPFEALADGTVVSVGGAKPRALVAILALEPGRVVSVDRLVEDLWPGETPDTAPHAVQVYVSQLRKALGAAAIPRRGPGYVLDVDPGRVDVHRFVRLADEGRETLAGGDPATAATLLREALGLWRGPALADFAYEPFAQADIARLEEQRIVALEERIEADLAVGRHAELVSELEALVKAQPLRERPRGQLMLALYRSGRQADALAAYRAARETLVEELGIDPGPELKRLEASILRQDESLLLEEEAAPLAKPAMQFRRLVTILFVDAVESMALAEALDAEALARVLQSYFETVSAAIERHGGAVEKFAGDAVMAAFGIPISHEDDSLRAARAAIEVRAGIAALNERLVRDHGVGLEVRIGFETGEVVATPTEARQRLVTGETVGIASRLEQAASAGEIVVGELAARMVDHAALLEPLGDLRIKGKREPVRPFRLIEITPVAPAFERRLDAPLVGRKRELAALRRSLKRAIDTGEARVAVVSGPPGVGKSRLAAEFARRVKGVTALFGRCLSYGEGITYWPLQEVLRQADGRGERDSVLRALEAETPPPAPEIAWMFRRFCEAVARERPLVLVFDDVHWAEPTFLELLEGVADRGEGAILVVCLAREELLEEQPSFLEGRENVERISLDVLSAEETDALLHGLAGTVLESDSRTRIVSAAEGNPFFLEQLLALALEGGLAERTLPETVQALLATRLDRLGPGERAVLERGAIVLRGFTHDDVVALVEPEAAPTVGAHLATLVARGFLRPMEEGTFRFRHVLVQDAAYRAAPKRLRAVLHERFADRLDSTAADLAELDEFVGYHLERAYQLRTELGESNRRVMQIARDGGLRLGASGLRAFMRADMPATTNLLERATTLLPDEDASRRQLLCELGLARYASHDNALAVEALANALERSLAAKDKRMEARSRIELEYVRLRTDPGRSADELLSALDDCIAISESVDDKRSLGRAFLLTGWVRGGRLCNHRAWAESAERALELYKDAKWPTLTCVGEIAAALYWGPTPVDEAVERYEQLRRDEAGDLNARAYVNTFLGGLAGQLGDFDRARALVQSALADLRDLGLDNVATTYCFPVLSEIELLAKESETAVRLLRELCAELERSKQFSRLASAASELADALTLLGPLDEAEAWAKVAQSNTSPDDVHAQMRWHPAQARIHAERGDGARAEHHAREGTRVSETTDDLNRQAKAYVTLGDVLRLTGNDEAVPAFRRALYLFERKGNLVGVRNVESVLNEHALV